MMHNLAKLTKVVSQRVAEGMVNNNIPGASFVAAAGECEAQGLEAAAALDPIKVAIDKSKHAAKVFNNKGIVEGGKQLASENYEEIKEAAGTNDFVRAADFKDEYSWEEQVIYAWSGAGKSFLIVYGGVKATRQVTGGGNKVGDVTGSMKVEEVKSVDRAQEIHQAVPEPTRNRTTIAVTETQEEVRIVSSSEKRLRPAQRRMLTENELEGIGAGHAEVKGVNAAKENGLTPTGTAASRPICPDCKKFLQRENGKLLSPAKKKR